MSIRELFSKKFTLVYCPYCSCIKKHNRWVTLTTSESQKLSKDHRAFSLIEETCPACSTKEAIGLAQ